MDSAGSSGDAIFLIPLILIILPCWFVYYLWNHKKLHAQWAEEKRQKEEHDEIRWLLQTAQNRHEVMSAMYNRHGENFSMDVIASDGTIHKVKFNRV